MSVGQNVFGEKKCNRCGGCLIKADKHKNRPKTVVEDNLSKIQASQGPGIKQNGLFEKLQIVSLFIFFFWLEMKLLWLFFQLKAGHKMLEYIDWHKHVISSTDILSKDI